eukprot:7228602-Pyramimonas_sp.AAC.1
MVASSRHARPHECVAHVLGEAPVETGRFVSSLKCLVLPPFLSSSSSLQNHVVRKNSGRSTEMPSS